MRVQRRSRTLVLRRRRTLAAHRGFLSRASSRNLRHSEFACAEIEPHVISLLLCLPNIRKPRLGSHVRVRPGSQEGRKAQSHRWASMHSMKLHGGDAGGLRAWSRGLTGRGVETLRSSKKTISVVVARDGSRYRNLGPYRMGESCLIFVVGRMP